MFIQRVKYLVRIIIFPSTGWGPCEICTGNFSCCCFLGDCWNFCSIINLLGVTTRITMNTSLNRCLYIPNEIYIYVSCKIFRTSNLNVLKCTGSWCNPQSQKKKWTMCVSFLWVLVPGDILQMSWPCKLNDWGWENSFVSFF